MNNVIAIEGKIKCHCRVCGFVINTANNFTMFIRVNDLHKFLSNGNKALGFNWTDYGLVSIHGAEVRNINIKEYDIQTLDSVRWNTYTELMAMSGIKHTTFNRHMVRLISSTTSLDDFMGPEIEIVTILYIGRHTVGYYIRTLRSLELFITKDEISKYFKDGYIAYRVKFGDGLVREARKHANYYKQIPRVSIDTIDDVIWTSYRELTESLLS